MTAVGGPRLLVTADLTVQLDAPDGRSTAVVLSDDAGSLRVDVGDVGVLLASLPRALPVGGGRDRRKVLALALDAHRKARASWDQPVDVLTGGRVVLRRRDGRWRPVGPAVVAVGAGLAGAMVVVGSVVSVVVLGLRRLLHP